jgi:N-methylhydantoinase B/oxoprolinase/acetone carboxylase alpha subunit
MEDLKAQLAAAKKAVEDLKEEGKKEGKENKVD